GRNTRAVCVLPRRRLEAEVADPVLRARVRAAVEVEPKIRYRGAERRLEMLDERLQTRLRLANREVAVRLARARDRVRPDLVRLERQADLGERGDGRVDVAYSRDDQVLLPREPHVAAELFGQVGDRNELLAGGEPEPDGDSDREAPVLLG